VSDMLGGNESSSDQAAMTARVVADAKRLYRDLADDTTLEQRAHQAVAEIWTGPIKVTAFVPVLALRRIREMLTAEGVHPIAKQAIGPLSAPASS
jgi:hypothetical protein